MTVRPGERRFFSKISIMLSVEPPGLKFFSPNRAATLPATHTSRQIIARDQQTSISLSKKVERPTLPSVAQSFPRFFFSGKFSSDAVGTASVVAAAGVDAAVGRTSGERASPTVLGLSGCGEEITVGCSGGGPS